MVKLIKEAGFKRSFKYLIFGLWDFIFQLLPYSPLRIFWLRLGGAHIGKNSFVDRIQFLNLDRLGLSGLTLDQECYLGPLVLLDLAGKIDLESQAAVSANSIVLTHHSVGLSDHPLLKHYPKKVSQVLIKAGSIISVGSIILPGITIGKHSLVAAGSVVRQSVPDNVMVAGVPAQVKKKLNEKKS